MKTPYSIMIQWSDDDACYIASLPEFGAYARTHGDTYEDALKNGLDVLALLIETTPALPVPALFHSVNEISA